MSSAPAVVWITDSTPLIVLAKIGLLHLLTSFAGTVVIPQIVAEEVQAGPEADPARSALAEGWGHRVPTPAPPPAVAALKLDAGEEAVLSVALGLPGSTAVLDDGRARGAARSLGVAVIGTLGIVTRAKVEGHIPAAKPVVQALQAVQFRADIALIQSILRGLGETWP